MPQHHHQTFDQSGNLIEERIEEYVETVPEPTVEQRVDALVVELNDIRSKVALLKPEHPDISAMRDAITGKSEK